MYEKVNPALFSDFDDEEFDGFNWRKKLKKAARFHPLALQARAAKEAQRIASNIIQFDSFDSFNAEEDEFDGFLKKVKLKNLNPLQRHTKFGKLIGKAAGLASVIPGVGGIAAALVDKGFNKGAVQADPAAAVQAAQAPQEAAAVVQALAPNLKPADRAAATADVMNASTPAAAAAVASAVTKADEKEKSKKKWLTIGGIALGGILLVILIIWLVKRK